MNSNTLLVILIDGGLVIFFLYALYYISKLDQDQPIKLSLGRDEALLKERGVRTEQISGEVEEPEEPAYERETGVEDEPSTIEELEVEEQAEDLTAVNIEAPVKERLEGIDIIDVEGIGLRTPLNFMISTLIPSRIFLKEVLTLLEEMR